jgi:glucokinase
MQSSYIGGLDIGGTKMAATIADINGPLVRVVEATAKTGTARAPAEQGVKLLQQACAKAGILFDRIDSVGVSSCGPFSRIDRQLHLVTPNLCGGMGDDSDLPNDWTSIPLEAVLREHFSTVKIENDCVAAIAAERSFGNARGSDDCAYVTWSTGIGFGLCVDGRLLHGKNGNAGHAGHMLLAENIPAQCGCGNFGDVEALVSGRNLRTRFGRSSTDIFTSARAGEEEALAIVREAAKWFGRALFNVTVTLDIKLFVIGGSVWQHHNDWLKPLVMHEIETRFSALTAGVAIVNTRLESHVADVGALYLVMPQDWIARWNHSDLWQKLRALAEQ